MSGLVEHFLRHFAKRSGILPRGQISFRDKAIDNWFEILKEAGRAEALDALVGVVAGEYPSRLAELQQHLASWKQPFAAAPRVQAEGGRSARDDPGQVPSVRQDSVGEAEAKAVAAMAVALRLGL